MVPSGAPHDFTPFEAKSTVMTGHFPRVRWMSLAAVLPLLTLGLGRPLLAQQPMSLIQQPYLLDTGLLSRSISFENPTGAPGEGGKAASNLGVGRKGSP
jgi:hypothetical protein